MLRYWNPWAVKDADGKVIENKTPEFPFQCAGGVCPFPAGAKKTAPVEGAGDATTAATETSETNGAPTTSAVEAGSGDSKKTI